MLPIVFERNKIEKLVPGMISNKNLAKLHPLGKDPFSFTMGRKVFFERDAIDEWILNYKG